MDDQERALRGYLNSLLLAVLTAGPLPGYAVLETLYESTGHRAGLSKGNVYPALRRHEHFGFISSHSSIVDGKACRVYELTTADREKLADDQTNGDSSARRSLRYSNSGLDQMPLRLF